MKETFSYEMVGDSAFLPHSERILSPFFASRSVGVRLNKVFPGDRGTVAVGAFNDWYEKDITYSDSAWDVTARLTGVPVWSSGGRRFVHVGWAWRYQGADEGVIRYKGAPESHVADNFVDTGSIPASHANHFGAEVLVNEGPVSLLGEYITAQVSSREAGDPSFSGWYLTASWVVTGETRGYDRNVGYARKVVPARRFGAVELVGRYSAVDTSDQAIDGGNMGKWLAQVSYYPTRRMRICVATGKTTLDKGGLTGQTTQTLARVQWIY
jgi:phosphate-selective porin OprO/OprP